MWQQLRSTVADGVKEFGAGALTEVSQGVSQVRLSHWGDVRAC